MNGKIAMVGRGDGITVFRAAGVETFDADTAERAREQIRKAAQSCNVIFVTEEFYLPNKEFLKRFDEEPYPVVMCIPSANGDASFGDRNLKEIMERALGVDILFNKD